MEARLLVDALARYHRLDVLLSLAGRTETPISHAVPVRIGGFGGGEGLAEFIRTGGYQLLIDATHPFAARISANAAEAVEKTGISAFRLSRPGWLESKGEYWTHAGSVPDALAHLGPHPRRIFLAIGRQEAHYALSAPHHFYLLRSVDPIEPPLVLEQVHCILSRGPFVLEDEISLLREHRIDIVITKNSGGDATFAKIEAARLLGIDIIMVARPAASGLPEVETIEAALRRVEELTAAPMTISDHAFGSERKKRGV